jgi:hypothetical protein
MPAQRSLRIAIAEDEFLLAEGLRRLIESRRAPSGRGRGDGARARRAGAAWATRPCPGRYPTRPRQQRSGRRHAHQRAAWCPCHRCDRQSGRGTRQEGWSARPCTQARRISCAGNSVARRRRVARQRACRGDLEPVLIRRAMNAAVPSRAALQCDSPRSCAFLRASSAGARRAGRERTDAGKQTAAPQHRGEGARPCLSASTWLGATKRRGSRPLSQGAAGPARRARAAQCPASGSARARTSEQMASWCLRIGMATKLRPSSSSSRCCGVILTASSLPSPSKK